MYEVPLLFFLSNIVDSRNDYSFLLDQFNDLVIGPIIRIHIKSLVKRGLIKLVIHHERSTVEIDSYSNEMDRICYEPASKSLSYSVGRRRISIPQHYRNRHSKELLHPQFPCLIAQGGYIRGTCPKIPHENTFPLEFLIVQVQGSQQQVNHVLAVHGHKWGPQAESVDFPTLNQSPDYQSADDYQPDPSPQIEDDWGQIELTPPREPSPVPETKRTTEAQTEISIHEDDDELIFKITKIKIKDIIPPPCPPTPTSDHGSEKSTQADDEWDQPWEIKHKPGSFGCRTLGFGNATGNWGRKQSSAPSPTRPKRRGNSLYYKNCNNKNVY